MNPSVALQEFINTHLATVEPLSRETALANWEMQTTSSDAVREKVTDLNTRFARIYADPDDYAFLKSLDAEAIDSPTLARQHLLLLNAYLENQIPAELMEKTIALTVEIEDSVNIFRGVIDGETISDNAIEKILDESRDVMLRKQAWEASKQVGQEVSERVLELVRMRNQAAITLGYENYYVMSLQMQELTEERLFQQLDDLAEKSEDLWNAFRDELDEHLALRFNTTPDAIRPWHHHNRFFQSPEPGNADLVARMKQVDELRNQGLPTIPSTIGLELKTNPFLRPDSPELRQSLSMEAANVIDVFAETRRRKDVF